MTATAHAAVGVTIAALISNPVIGIPVAFVSHIVCDLTPHWDAGTHMKRKSRRQFAFEGMADVLISFLVTFFLLLYVFPQVNIYYGFLLAFTAQLLDWLTVPYLFLKIKSAPFNWIYKFQHAINVRLDKPWGIITQASVVIILLLLAKYS